MYKKTLEQGEMQGPFLSSEMAEWFRAGYFTTSLMVRRQCDERFYMLGDLVTLCAGNPFQTNVRIAPLKLEQPKMHHEPDLQFQLLQTQLALRQAAVRALGQTEPWGGLSPLQQRDLAQHLLASHPPVRVGFKIVVFWRGKHNGLWAQCF